MTKYGCSKFIQRHLLMTTGSYPSSSNGCSNSLFLFVYIENRQDVLDSVRQAFMWIWSLDKMKNIIAFLALVGIFKTGESAIIGWTKPVISTPEGTGTLDERINNGTTATSTTGITITATSGDVGGVTAYTLFSQDPATPVLAIHATTGAVTVTSGIVDYSLVTSFTIIVSANDAGQTASTATITLSVNAAPSFSPHSNNPCIADGAVAGTDLIDLSATDANSDSIKYAITSGNTKSDFAITATGTVEVATGKTLNMTATSSYTLVITATDDSSTPLTTTATVTATVSTTCSAGGDSGAAALAVTYMTILLALIVSLQ